MSNALVRAISSAALLCLLLACDSLSEERIAVGYVPSASIAALPGAERVTVSVGAADKRAGLRDRIATKRAITTARVIADNDVIELVRGAVERELTAQGFAQGAGGIAITVEVQNFYSDFQPAMTATADVAFTLRAKDHAGATLYTRFYDGTARIANVVNQSAENARLALQQALAGALRQLVEDRALQAALLSPRRSPPAPGRT